MLKNLIPFYLFILILISCKQKEEVTIDYSGKEIEAVNSDEIILNDKTTIKIDPASVKKVFYLVRHAEKDTTSNPQDPILTEAGTARATKLASILKGTRVDAIYSTLTYRTMYTVQDIAEIKGMSILPYENKSLKQMFTNIDNDEQNNRVLIVGHSNTIPSIVNTLADKPIFDKIFDESDYGNFIIVVTKNEGPADVYKLRF